MSTSTTDPPAETDDGRARRLRGAVLLLGAAAIAGLVEGGILDYYTFPLLLGLVYLAAAAISRSHGTLWGPGLVTTAVGLAVALWFGAGRGGDSFQLLALTVMALGLGGVLAALLGQAKGFAVSAMSVAMPVLLFGGFALLEQQAVKPFAGSTWVYVALLVVWGAYELRPATQR